MTICISLFSREKSSETIKVTDYDLIFVDWLSSGLSYCNQVVALMEEAVAKNIPVIITTTYIDHPSQVIIADKVTEYQWVRHIE